MFHFENFLFRKFLRLGSPLCSRSSYAVLRGPEKPDNNNDKLLDTSITPSKNRRASNALSSLRISNGDIQWGGGEAGVGESGEGEGSNGMLPVHEEELNTTPEDDDGTDEKTIEVDNISLSPEYNLCKSVVAAITTAEPATLNGVISVNGAPTHTSENTTTDTTVNGEGNTTTINNIEEGPHELTGSLSSTPKCSNKSGAYNGGGSRGGSLGSSEGTTEETSAVHRIESLLDETINEPQTQFSVDFQKELYRYVRLQLYKNKGFF